MTRKYVCVKRQNIFIHFCRKKRKNAAICGVFTNRRRLLPVFGIQIVERDGGGVLYRLPFHLFEEGDDGYRDVCGHKNGKVKRYGIFLYAGAFMRRHSVIAVVRQIMNISPYIAANE